MKFIITALIISVSGLFWAGCVTAGATDDEGTSAETTGEASDQRYCCPCCRAYDDSDDNKGEATKEHHHVKGEWCPCCEVVWDE
jgi:hypothetical protein